MGCSSVSNIIQVNTIDTGTSCNYIMNKHPNTLLARGVMSCYPLPIYIDETGNPRVNTDATAFEFFNKLVQLRYPFITMFCENKNISITCFF